MALKQSLPPVAEKDQITSGEHEEDEDQGSFGSSDDVSSAPRIVDIDPRGDMLLQVKHYDKSSQDYRVSVSWLRKYSAYFNALLDPVKFSEGTAVGTRLVELRSFGDTASMSSVDLPRVTISDIGQAQKTKPAFKMFLEILHNRDGSIQTPGLYFISILALIADRFDAAAAVSSYVENHGWKKRLARPVFNNKSTAQIELIRRQKIFIGLTFGFQDWVSKNTSDLIYQGSRKWTSEITEDDDEETPWWYLPNGIEEELYHRRNYVFDTIGSIQSHFIHVYSRNYGQTECRLGYDSSWQCDIFQLGQMIRHFTRKGTLNMQSTYASFQDPPQHADSIEEFLSILRQCPTYQVNPNHSHCGPRANLEPALCQITSTLPQTGICLRCWKRNQVEESWEKNPLGGKWYLGMPRLRKLSEQCHDHRTTKALCTAKERDWTPLNVQR